MKVLSLLLLVLLEFDDVDDVETKNPAATKSIDMFSFPYRRDFKLSLLLLLVVVDAADEIISSPKTLYAGSHANEGDIFTLTLMKCFGRKSDAMAPKEEEEDDATLRFLSG